MSRVTTEARRWRKKGQRGVSPIIATILLVAITVVLAAVLYILISGLTGTSGSKPYTVGFGQGNPSAGTAIYYDELPLSVTSGLTSALFNLKVVTPTGVGVAPTVDTTAAANACGYTGAVMSGAAGAFTGCTIGAGTSWYAVLANQNGNVIAVYDSGGWHIPAAAGGAQVVTNSDEIVVVSGTVYAGSAYTLSAIGASSSSVSGSTTL